MSLDLTKFDKLNLGNYDFMIAIDRSGSMSSSDCPEGSRWKQSHKWSKEIAMICERYDSDGIDLIVFDDSTSKYTGVTSAKVDEIFRKEGPRGSTDTAKAIRTALPEYFESSWFGKSSKKVTRKKPVILIILTDGEPDSQKDVQDAIIAITKKISDRKEVGITFLQVGKNESARRFLKNLDNNLTGADFDIVDTVTYEESGNMSVDDILIGALTD